MNKNECATIATKHELLKSRLDKNLQKQRILELQISQQYEKLRKLEMALEKCTFATEERQSAFNSKCSS